MKSKENNKGFGFLFFIVFLLIGLWPLIKGDNPRMLFFPIALAFLILGIMNAKILTPLNRSWIKFGEILGKIIAPIVMALVYFVILTPLSFLIRISGKDLLKVKFYNKVNTYWIKRIKDLGPMNKQF
jgi:predicted membrane metal-binding protein